MLGVSHVNSCGIAEVEVEAWVDVWELVVEVEVFWVVLVVPVMGAVEVVAIMEEVEVDWEVVLDDVADPVPR